MPGVAAAPEVAASASKDSGVVVVRGDSVQCAVVVDAATADVASHRCGSNRDCDSRCLVVGDVANHDLTVADAVALHDVAVRSVVAAGPVAASALHVAVNCESDPDVVAPSVAAVPANSEFVLDVAVRCVVAVAGSDESAAVPVAVAPSAVAAPANCVFAPAAVVPNAAAVPANCFAVPAPALGRVVIVLLAVERDAAHVAPLVPAVVARALPDSDRCAPARDRACLVQPRRRPGQRLPSTESAIRRVCLRKLSLMVEKVPFCLASLVGKRTSALASATAVPTAESPKKSAGSRVVETISFRR